MAKRVLLTGVTGFVGSHVLPTLRAHGFEVIGATRHPEGHEDFRYIDLGDAASVRKALEGVDAVVYLVHSVGGSKHYEETERRYALTLRAAAEDAKLERIVYLGGIRPRGAISKHLESRLETGRVLRGGRVPAIELQATMIVGGGSESFRIVRDLAARLPWMLLPKWLKSETEPVAIADIAKAIVFALAMLNPTSRVLAVPGPERLTGRAILVRTAHALGQEPRMIDVPFVTPSLSTHWIRLVTRVNPAVARELVEGLRSDIVADGETVWSLLKEAEPDFERTSFDDAVRRALREEERSLPERTRLVEGLIHRVAE